MNKLNFIKNGVSIRLPPGFRFHPTDEELIVQYLKKKVHSFPLPASIIPEFDICKSDPWDLPGDSEQERYFFSTKESKYPNGNRSNRATFSGYWKATGIDKRIVVSNGNQLVGMKKTLVFYRGKPPNGSKTDWIMHEYRLATSAVKPLESSKGDVTAAMENWVLCRVFLKKNKKGSKNEEVINEEKSVIVPKFFDFMAAKELRTDLKIAPVSSCSDSSGITEEFPTTHEQDDHEESSTFLPFKSKS
ncbi:NAC domain-containing protein 83-like [Impatiens glandulifera]|uniref:NAC domain-containing protein 83-like n=1 Tax=Impatiens glandulifera TaxID=253017 RepID=UPI001FB05417|nr:NAC domain-containing protein 83-like [Impatiens glandulifera]